MIISLTHVIRELQMVRAIKDENWTTEVAELTKPVGKWCVNCQGGGTEIMV